MLDNRWHDNTKKGCIFIPGHLVPCVQSRLWPAAGHPLAAAVSAPLLLLPPLLLPQPQWQQPQLPAAAARAAAVLLWISTQQNKRQKITCQCC
jgi:hypothetical protein